jgi:hypothetical protein
MIEVRSQPVIEPASRREILRDVAALLQASVKVV